MGEHVFNLEEEIEEKDRKLIELEDDLKNLDAELAEKQAIHDQVVASLKEVSKEFNFAESQLYENSV